MKAVNPITGKVAFQKVTERHARTTQAGLVKVTLKDEAGKRETLTVTFNHPYLRAANENDPGLNLVKMEPGGQWSAAGLLKLGDKVQSGAVGELEVVKVEQLDNTSARVYNLEVAGYHSYAVGTLEAWVHNAIVFEEGGVKGVYHPGDHGPPHIHITGEGPETRIGQNGKPIEKDPEMTRKQRAACANNKTSIRRFLRKVMKNYKRNRNARGGGR